MALRFEAQLDVEAAGIPLRLRDDGAGTLIVDATQAVDEYGAFALWRRFHRGGRSAAAAAAPIFARGGARAEVRVGRHLLASFDGSRSTRLLNRLLGLPYAHLRVREVLRVLAGAR